MTISLNQRLVISDTDAELTAISVNKHTLGYSRESQQFYEYVSGSWGALSFGGSDPWTTVILGSDFSTTNAIATAVTGMNFTPAAGTRYLVEIHVLLRTATATVGARPGISWPTGLSDSGAWLQAPNSATAYAQRSWGAASTASAASTGLPDTTNSHLAIGGAYFITDGSPSGTFGLTLASETGGTSVTMRAGSILMYRTI